MAIAGAIRLEDSDPEISSHIEIGELFPQIPEQERRLLVEILEISKTVRAVGTHVDADGDIDTTIETTAPRFQGVRVRRDTVINDATTENALDLETTQWRKRNGLWAVQRESEVISIRNQNFKANRGTASRDRFSVGRVTTTGRNLPVIGFGVGSMRHLISNSMPLDAQKIDTKSEIGPTSLQIESFEGQNLRILLDRFKDRLKAAL